MYARAARTGGVSQVLLIPTPANVFFAQVTTFS
jgi:hypothetical protein